MHNSTLFSSPALKNVISYIAILMFIILSLSCSKGPDVRVELCQDLTIELIGSEKELKWTENKIQSKELEEVIINLVYKQEGVENSSVNGKSVCYYRYEPEAEIADGIGAPLSVYSTYPYKMLFNDKVIRGKELATMVNQVMIKQGKAAINKAVLSIYK